MANHFHPAVRVIFLQVRNPTEKIHKIPKIAKQFFEKKERLLIKAKDKKALQFLDNLLWRIPEDSFLPHLVSQKPCNDIITLTDSDANPNGALAIFNLSGKPLLDLPNTNTTIYEFEDLTSAQKKIVSEEHLKAYRSAGYSISII